MAIRINCHWLTRKDRGSLQSWPGSDNRPLANQTSMGRPVPPSISRGPSREYRTATPSSQGLVNITIPDRRRAKTILSSMVYSLNFFCTFGLVNSRRACEPAQRPAALPFSAIRQAVSMARALSRTLRLPIWRSAQPIALIT